MLDEAILPSAAQVCEMWSRVVVQKDWAFSAVAYIHCNFHDMNFYLFSVIESVVDWVWSPNNHHNIFVFWDA